MEWYRLVGLMVVTLSKSHLHLSVGIGSWVVGADAFSSIGGSSRIVLGLKLLRELSAIRELILLRIKRSVTKSVVFGSVFGSVFRSVFGSVFGSVTRSVMSGFLVWFRSVRSGFLLTIGCLVLVHHDRGRSRARIALSRSFSSQYSS